MLVFLSHTSELRQLGAGVSFVDAAEKAVIETQNSLNDMKYFPAEDSPPAEVCQRKVTESEVYVGIIGFRYGSPVVDRPEVSYTELEFEAATNAGIRRLLFLLHDEDTVGRRAFLRDPVYDERQAAFRLRVRTSSDLHVRTVSTPEELRNSLALALSELSHQRQLDAVTAPRPGPVEWIPKLTDHVVARPALADELAASLLAPGGNRPVGMTALHGGGGFGKTTLAGIVCRRPDVREHFPDGVLWVDVGQDLADARLAGKINGLCQRLGEERSGPADPMQAGMRFGELLGSRRMLVVIDDVWSAEQLTPFLQGGPECQRLVTTRDRGTVPVWCPVVSVHVMELDQAAQLLTGTLPDLGAATARELAARCGRWPVLLRLVAAHLKTRIAAGMPVTASLDEVAQGLDAAGVAAFDDANRRARAVATTIEASLRLLAEPGAPDGGPLARYQELAVFAEDTAVPRDTLETLWGHTAGWRGWDVARFCDRLADLSLVQLEPGEPPGLRLHDVIRQYIRGRVGAALPAMHATLLDAYRDRVTPPGGSAAWWSLPARETYLWRTLAVHLHQAGERDELAALVGDLRWAEAKIHRGEAVGAEADLALLPGDPVALALGRLIRQTAHLYRAGDPRGAVTATLASYAAGVEALRPAAEALSRHTARPALTPVAPLPDQPDPALRRTLTGHVGWVTALAVAPDGSWLASGGGGDMFGGGDGTVRIWHPTAGMERAVLGGHPGGVSALVAAPDGAWLASAGRDGTVRVWDPCGFTEQHVLPAHRQRVSALVAAPDGGWLASGGLDCVVGVWDPATGERRAALAGHTGWISALAAAPDGSWLASAADGVIRLWDVAASGGAASGGAAPGVAGPGRAAPGGAASGVVARATLTGHTGWVSALVAGPDGTWLASGGGDRTVRLWDVATGTQRAVLAGHAAPVSALAAGPDGSWLASGAADGTVRVWDPVTGAPRAALDGHSGPVSALAAAPDGTWLASAGSDGLVRIWDPAGGTLQAVLTGDARNAAILAAAPDGTWLASAGGDGPVRIWDPAVGSLDTTGRGGGGVAILDAPGTGAWLASGNGDGTVRVWDAATGAGRAAFSGHTSPVTALAVAPDGSWVASADEDGPPRVWDPVSGAQRAALDGHTGRVSVLATAPDGSWVASGGIDATVALWAPGTGERLAVLEGHTSRVSALAVAPDGSWLASGGIDATVRVWDVATGGALGALLGHTSRVSAMAAAPDGTWLASAGTDATVRVWDVAARTQLALLGGHSDGVIALAAAFDGSWLASAGTDRAVRVWDVAGGTVRAVLDGHSDDIVALAAAPDGPWLASASRDHTLRVWNAATGHLAAMLRVEAHLHACRWIPNRLVAGGARGLYLLTLTD